MASFGGRAVLLLGCVGLLAAPAAAMSTNEVALPGDPHYWVYLKYLEVSEGHLEPPFSEDADDFTLVVRDPTVNTLILSLGLNLRMYNLMFCPRITVDGNELMYSPLDAVSVHATMNRTIGPVDRVIHIKLEDPSDESDGLFGTDRSHTYNIHVLQPPNFHAVVLAQDIQVTDMDGNPVDTRPRFDPETTQYVYRLKATDMHARLRVDCSEFATGLRIDGAEATQGEFRTVDLVQSRASVMAECEYTHARWAPLSMSRAYEIVFEKEVHLGHVNVALIAEGQDGVCSSEQVPLHAGDKAQGFVCRVDVSVARFIVVYNNTDARVVLEKDGTGNQVHMRHGLPADVYVGSEGRQRYTLRVSGGQEVREYPVLVISAAQCTSLRCPRDQALRADVMSTQLAGAHLCYEEECSEKDYAHCCEDRQRCSAFRFGCPEHQKLRPDAGDVLCATGACKEEEKDLCCTEALAKCSSMACPEGTHLRGDAHNVTCASWECRSEDRALCCQRKEVARCDTYELPCPEHQELRLDAKRLKCKSDACTIEDQSTCCASVPDSALGHARAEDRVAFYKDIGCSPKPGNYCTIWHERCFYDASCEGDPPRNGGLGCWAGGVHQRCRFCGFGIYEDCPEHFDCFDGHCEAWSQNKTSWCLKHYNFFCYRAQINDIPQLPDAKDKKHQAVFSMVMKKFVPHATNLAHTVRAGGFAWPCALLLASGALLALASAVRWGVRAPRNSGYASFGPAPFDPEQQAPLA